MRNTAGRREVMVNQRSDRMSVPSVCRERGISLGIRWRFLARGIEYFAAAGCGVTPSMTTLCEGTLALNLAVDLPRSFLAQRSRTAAERWPGYPRSSHETEISASEAPRFNNTTARLNKKTAPSSDPIRMGLSSSDHLACLPLAEAIN